MAVVLDPDLSEHVAQVYDWLIRHGHTDRAPAYLEREPNPMRRLFYQGLLDWHAGRQDAARNKWNDVLAMEVQRDNAIIETWMEAALRLDEPKEVTDLAAELAATSHTPSAGTLMLTAAAHLVQDETQEARNALDLIILRLERGWPARTQIPREQWLLLKSLVPDPSARDSVADLFETGEDGN
jgi:hypothetical protein